MAKFNLSGFEIAEPKEQKSEGYGAYAGRQLLSGLEKIPESALSLNEALRSAGQILPITRPIFKGVQAAQEAIGIPTAEQFRRGAEKVTGYEQGSFNPQGFGENVTQEAIRIGGTLGLGEAASALGAGQKVLGAGQQALRAVGSNIKPILGSAVGAETGKAAGQQLGLPDIATAGLELTGSILGGSYGTRSKVAKSYNKNYKKADAILADTTQKLGHVPFEDAPDLKVIADQLQNKISKGLGYEKGEEPLERLFGLLANNNRVEIPEATNLMREINDQYWSYPYKVKKGIIEPIVNGIKDKVMAPYGKVNKPYYQAWDTARQDYSALNKKFFETEKIYDRIEKIFEEFPLKLGDTAKKALGYLALGAGGYKAITNPLFGAGFAGGVASLNEINKFGGLIKNSPNATRIIKETEKQLRLGKLNNAVKIINELDKEMPQKESSLSGFTIA